MRSKPKTSVDILHERDELERRTCALEATLVEMRAEIDRALHRPSEHFLALCRLDAIVRDAIADGRDASEGDSPLAPLSKTRPANGDALVSRRAG